jgi:hypothetical protein
MKAWSVIGLLFTAAIIATMPISLQVTPLGVELGVDQAQAITYRHYRRAAGGSTVAATTVVTTAANSRSAAAAANGTRGSLR